MTTYHRIVLTTGTSAFTGGNHFAPPAVAAGLVTVDRAAVRPPAGRDEDDALDAVREWVAHLDVAAAPIEKTSAELSLLGQLRHRGMLAPRPAIALVHSDTFGGAAAASVVARVAEAHFGAAVTLRRASDLDVDDTVRLSRSLGGFMAVVSEELEKGDPRTTCFAPIGGYKVMTALGYLVGCIRGYPMAYVHESNQRLHVVRALPVAFADAVLDAHREAFLRLHREQVVAVESLDALARQLVRDHGYLFEQTEGEVAFSPFGAFLAARTLRRRVFASTAVEHEVRDGEARTLVLAELRDLVAQLEDPVRHRGSLHHEASWGVRDAPHALFKGASGRAGVLRATYWVDELGDVRVDQVWTDHGKYDREVRAALARPRRPDGTDVSALLYGG